ncbi:MAG: glycosyltransferase family 2 protein [Desulfosporosinus sp.]|nr:glycosyltransferase family 2 protein [Desulfosporosinus sp.]
MKKKLLSVIAPMFNEEELVFEYCTATLQVFEHLHKQYDCELVLVDDGSKDKTLEKMRQIRQQCENIITIVSLSRNFGLEGAVSAGLRKASGDAVVVMDADLQDPPVLILKMVKAWESGANIVIASRTKRSNDNFFKQVSAKIYYALLNSLSGQLNLDKSAANYRLLDRKAVNQILSLPEVNGVFRISVPFIGMKTVTVEYDRAKRAAGKSKYSLGSMIRYALDSLTGISVEPLRRLIWTLPITALIALVSIIGMFVSTDIWRVGFMLSLVISILFFLLFVSIGLIGEYIAQIMIEVKGRPTAIIYEYLPCENAKKGE